MPLQSQLQQFTSLSQRGRMSQTCREYLFVRLLKPPLRSFSSTTAAYSLPPTPNGAVAVREVRIVHAQSFRSMLKYRGRLSMSEGFE